MGCEWNYIVCHEWAWILLLSMTFLRAKVTFLKRTSLFCAYSGPLLKNCIREPMYILYCLVIIWTRDQIANIHWIINKAREFQKNIYFCSIDYAKAFDCVDHNTLWKILKEMGVPDHLTCLLRNLYGGQEATVRTGHGTTDWFQIGKGVRQGCIFSPCLFN